MIAVEVGVQGKGLLSRKLPPSHLDDPPPKEGKQQQAARAAVTRVSTPRENMSVTGKDACSGTQGSAADADDVCNGSSGSPPALDIQRSLPAPSEQEQALDPGQVRAISRRLCSELRQENPALLGSCIVNDDLAVAFVHRYQRMVSELGSERAQPRVAFHGTSSSNFDAIISGNLRVPDGSRVVSASGRSTYGFGIYVSTSFDLALMYGRKHASSTADAAGGGPGGRDNGAIQAPRRNHAADKKVFVCLCLPGRQHVSAPPADTACRAVRPGFDSHVSADRGGQISVYFDSAQILPCFLSTREMLVCAQEAAVRAVDSMLKATPAAARGEGSSAGAGDAGSTETAEGGVTVDADLGESSSFLQRTVGSLFRGPRAGLADADTRSVQCFEASATPGGHHHTADVAAAQNAALIRTVAARVARQPTGFATAEWDNVNKRVKYS